MFGELYNFVFSCIISGDNTGDPLTISDAVANISEFRKHDPELFAGVTPEDLVAVWNSTLEQVHR